MFFKKNLRYIGPVFSLVLLSLSLCWFINQQDLFEPTMDYGVQLADDLYYTNPDIQKWVDSVRHEPGVYQQKIDHYTYLLICAGELSREGYSLTLVDTLQAEDTIQVIYSLIQTHPDEISQGVTTPFMLVRVPSQARMDLVAKAMEESEISNYLNPMPAVETATTIEE